eukprot:SAG22_NODE_357_length_11761_cov_2.572115_6_plen_1079_part_00
MRTVLDADGAVKNATLLAQSARAVLFQGASGDVRLDDKLDRVGSYAIIHFKSAQVNGSSVTLANNIGEWNAGGRSIAMRFDGDNPSVVLCETKSKSFWEDNIWFLPVLLTAAGVVGVLTNVYRNRKRARARKAHENDLREYRYVREATDAQRWKRFDLDGKYANVIIPEKAADLERAESARLVDVRVDVATRTERALSTISESPDQQNSPDTPKSTTVRAASYYSKFCDTGYIGTFADMTMFHRGLDGMVGGCSKNVYQAMAEEHTKISAGFGASDAEFETGNYGIRTTARQEWDFVVFQTSHPAMEKETERRESKDIGTIHEEAFDLICECFAARAKTDRVFAGVRPSRSHFAEVCPLCVEECIGMRLYTGPMFTLYNSVLRAYGNKTQPGFVLSHLSNFSGMPVAGRFVTTIHSVNSGILKCSRLQPACKIYRGISGMHLPDSFLDKNAYNVQGGVEYGFMSCTTDINIAITYAAGGEQHNASTLMEADMGMVDRGAALDWLSQYPKEREILLPPLTAIEVLKQEEKPIKDLVAAQASSGHSTPRNGLSVNVVSTRLNCNMLSHTLDRLKEIRKKQVIELSKLIARELRVDNGATGPDIDARRESLSGLQKSIDAENCERFNDNAKFTEYINSALAQLPQLGDQLRTMDRPHIGLNSLVPFRDGLLSCSWDGKLKFWDVGADHIQLNFQGDCTGGALCVLPILLQPDGLPDRVLTGTINGAVAVSHIPKQSETRTLKAITKDMMTKHKVAGLIKDTRDDDEAEEKGHRVTRQSCSTCRTLLGGSGTETATISESNAILLRETDRNDSLAKAVSASHHFEWAKGGSVTALAAVPDPRTVGRSIVACGSYSGQISVWIVAAADATVETKNSLRISRPSPVSALLWIPALERETGLLVAGCLDGRVVAWQFKVPEAGGVSFKLLPQTGSHDGGVSAMVMATLYGKRVLATSSNDHTLKFWRLERSESPLVELTSPVSSLRLSAGICSLAFLSSAAGKDDAEDSDAEDSQAISSLLAVGLGDHTIQARARDANTTMALPFSPHQSSSAKASSELNLTFRLPPLLFYARFGTSTVGNKRRC